jgi:hypothetical protein
LKFCPFKYVPITLVLQLNAHPFHL